MEFMHGALERDKREGVSQRNEAEEGLVVTLRQSARQPFPSLFRAQMCLLFTLEIQGFISPFFHYFFCTDVHFKIRFQTMQFAVL